MRQTVALGILLPKTGRVRGITCPASNETGRSKLAADAIVWNTSKGVEFSSCPMKAFMIIGLGRFEINAIESGSLMSHDIGRHVSDIVFKLGLMNVLS